MRFPTYPPDILSRADELLSAKYGTDRPIDPEIVELVCRGMMGERERCAKTTEALLVPAFLVEGEAEGHYDGREFMRDYIAKAIRGTE